MFPLTLTLAALGLLCLLIGAAQQARHTIPAPASGWRDGDVLSRRTSAVDVVHSRRYSSGELFGMAEEVRNLGGPLSDIRAFMDLGRMRLIGERIAQEQDRQRRERRHVQARVRVRPVGA